MARSVAFYTEVLKMKILGRPSTGTAADGENDDVVIGYASDQTAFSLRATGTAPAIEQYEGRNAVSMPAELLQEVYKAIAKETPELVVHEIQALEEQVPSLPQEPPSPRPCHMMLTVKMLPVWRVARSRAGGGGVLRQMRLLTTLVSALVF